MEQCPKCYKGKIKYTRTEYTVKTRHVNRNELKFENLPVKECTICDFVEIQKIGEEMIEAIKLVIKNEMQRMSEDEQKEIKQKKNVLLSTLKKIIG